MNISFNNKRPNLKFYSIIDIIFLWVKYIYTYILIYAYMHAYIHIYLLYILIYLMWTLWVPLNILWVPFPSGASDKEPTCHGMKCKRHWLNPWVGKIPWRKAQQLTPVFSILAWRIQRTEEPGRLQSMGLQRVWHNWSNLACTQRQDIFHCASKGKSFIPKPSQLIRKSYSIFPSLQNT